MLEMRERRYKLWWFEKGDRVCGVGVMVKELCKKVVEVGSVSDRVLTVVVVFEEDVLRLICWYAPQIGRSLEEEQVFCNELKGEWYMHCVGDLVMCLVDFNGHVGRHIVGVHGWDGVGQWNLEGRMS